MTIPTTDLCDAHEDALQGGTLRVLAPMFRSFGGKRSFAGAAATLKFFEDNSFVRKTLESAGEGRVLVIDAGGSLRRAVVGDQLAALAVKNGWAGILVYGCIRDCAAISTMDIGIFALGTHPQKTDKNNVGEAEVAVAFGGVTIRPGDWVYADEDGVLVSDQQLSL